MVSNLLMLEAKAPSAQLRRAYNLFNSFYGPCFGWFEREGIRAGLQLLALRPGDRVLEVAFGPGSALIEIARRVGEGGSVDGVDLSPGMVKRARKRLEASGVNLRDLRLREGDARRLPFPEARFDALFNSYMMDLLSLHDIDVALGEYRRVLVPGGRLCLTNFSKRRPDRLTPWERVYRSAPSCCVAYLLGGCRPVLLEDAVRRAGFEKISRRFLAAPFPTEIIAATKPARSAPE